MKLCSRLSKACSILMALSAVTNTAIAQDEPQFTITQNGKLPDFVTVIDGSKTPELIPDNSAYGSFARYVVSSNPPNCNPAVNRASQPTVSSISPCLEPLEGLDMGKVIQLANEYQLRRRINAEIPLDICSTRRAEFSNMSVSTLVAFLDGAQASNDADEAAFFVMRAHELFGDQEYETLMKYIDREKRHMVKTVIDQEKALRMSGVTPILMIEQMCNQNPNTRQ